METEFLLSLIEKQKLDSHPLANTLNIKDGAHDTFYPPFQLVQALFGPISLLSPTNPSVHGLQARISSRDRGSHDIPNPPFFSFPSLAFHVILTTEQGDSVRISYIVKRISLGKRSHKLQHMF